MSGTYSVFGNQTSGLSCEWLLDQIAGIDDKVMGQDELEINQKMIWKQWILWDLANETHNVFYTEIPTVQDVCWTHRKDWKTEDLILELV